jgi:hypothetical protein
MIPLPCEHDLEHHLIDWPHCSEAELVASALRPSEHRWKKCFRLLHSEISIVGSLLLAVIFLHLDLTAAQPLSADPVSSTTSSDSKGQTAFVSVSRAQIYSGPSEEYYPTGNLVRGTAIEVFHRTETGWLAIRPPKGSFSWVIASDAYLLPGGKSIEITAKNAVAWIGSTLGAPKQYRWQVRLDAGEQLIVLGEEVVKDAEGKEKLWYRVSPPNGEFRWIQSGLITDEPPSKVAADSQASNNSAVVPAGAEESEEDQAGAVRSTAFQNEIFFDSIDGEVVEGGVYIQGMPAGNSVAIAGSVGPVPDSSWTDWQLFEFTDQGLRFPLWERALSRNASQYDPLVDDPFSLAMAPKTKGHAPRPLIHEPSMPSAPRRRSPWRDPRMLGELRRSGYPQASAQRGSGATFSALQEAWNSGASAQRGGQGSDYWSSDSTNGQQFRPRVAPQPNDSAAWHGYEAGSAGDRFRLASSGVSAVTDSSDSTLLQLQIRLSELVTQPMLQWNFTELKEQLRQVIHSGSSPIVRGEARLLMERVEDFERLAVRSGYFIAGANEPLGSAGVGSPTTFNPATHTSLASTQQGGSSLPSGHLPFSSAASAFAQTGAAVQPASFIAPQRSSGGESRSAEGFAPRGGPPTGFEASGWLVPVHATTPGQPTHAITDESGRIVAYVTGLPGMNLDRYINQPVGINGLRGFLPQFQAAHIEAQNVVRLR